MLIAFVALLCMFYNLQHLFLSISHGTGHSISVSLFTACPMLPHSLFPFISLNPGAIITLLITTEALSLMLGWEAVLTSSLLLSLLQRSPSSDLQTLPACLVTENIYLHSDILRLTSNCVNSVICLLFLFLMLLNHVIC